MKFDTLRFYKKLRAGGVPEAQAEVQAELMRDLIISGLIKTSNPENYPATKQGSYEAQKDIKSLEINLKKEIKDFEEKLTYNLTIRLGGMLITGITALAILIKIL